MVKDGQKVQVHYTGTFDSGEEFDSSHERGSPLELIVGTGQVIPGFESAILGMTEGEVKNISLSPEDAYGDFHEELVATVGKDTLPDDFNFKVGDDFRAETSDGHLMIGRVTAEEEKSVTLDFNHPIAGKNLNFTIEVVDVADVSEQEEMRE